MTTVREIWLKRRPVGTPTAEDFEVATVDLPEPAPGEVQVRNTWMTVDPYMRGRMNDVRSYTPPFQLGKAMEGGAIGQVTASNDPSLHAGDLVSSNLGWREGFTTAAKDVRKLDARNLPPQAFLGIAGMPGMTAYAGLIRVAELKAEDVVFVSGAAGAVGSVVCQIAKLRGHTVIGSAGGPAKTAYLKSIGVDQVIDYKAEDSVLAALMRAAPTGIDVYFDNVGTDHLEAALVAMRPFGRIALCGAISQYNATDIGPGTRGLVMAVGKQLTLRGFVVSSHYDMMGEYLDQLSDWVAAGKIHWEETVLEGIDNAPNAFLGLFKGDNLGKMLVKLA